MKTTIPENDIMRIIEASKDSALRTAVNGVISRCFRSPHYVASKLICDGVVANIMLNDEITPHSADEIILCIFRNHRSVHVTVDNAYYSVEERFLDYAKLVLGDDYDEIRNLKLRNTDFIIYVISLDMSRKSLNRDEVYLRAFTYAELMDKKLPHY